MYTYQDSFLVNSGVHQNEDIILSIVWFFCFHRSGIFSARKQPRDNQIRFSYHKITLQRRHSSLYRVHNHWTYSQSQTKSNREFNTQIRNLQSFIE